MSTRFAVISVTLDAAGSNGGSIDFSIESGNRHDVVTINAKDVSWVYFNIVTRRVAEAATALVKHGMARIVLYSFGWSIIILRPLAKAVPRG